MTASHFPAFNTVDEANMIAEIRRQGVERSKLLETIQFLVDYRAKNARLGSTLDDAVRILAHEYNRKG